MALGTLEHSELSAVLHVTDLRGDNHGGEIKQDETYRALRESLLDVDEVQAPDQLPEPSVLVLPELEGRFRRKQRKNTRVTYMTS